MLRRRISYVAGAVGGALLLVAALVVVRPGAAGEPASGPAGRVEFVGCAGIDPALFAGGKVEAAAEAPARVFLFDRGHTPSGYRTCYEETLPATHLRLTQPYNDAAFPRNVAPPQIRWEDRVDNLWLLELTAPGWRQPLRVITCERSWRPDAATWEAIKASGTGGWIELSLRGCVVKDGKRADDTVYADHLRFRVSTYPADPIIVYRLVTPQFSPIKTPDIYYRRIDSFDERLFLPGQQTYCTNCHSFPSSPDVPEKDFRLAIAVRSQLEMGKKRMILGLYDFATREGQTLNINSYFMSWNPQGTKVAVTGGTKTLLRPLITLETQEFYVAGADILIVDAADKNLEGGVPLPGASEPDLMESFPAWSPDGKTILFARAPELHNDIFEERRYDLYEVPFNDGRGGVATPVPGASANGLSNFSPRYSPDGKWIVFTKCEYASLVSPTSDLYILSTAEGALPRKLECNCDYAMDSHHSWSSNSRWLVFASKREDGIFARLYFTEIDDQGHASPPVELPILNESRMLCYNVPEFLRITPDIDPNDMVAKISRLKE